jgi:paraquat-inducible protein B
LSGATNPKVAYRLLPAKINSNCRAGVSEKGPKSDINRENRLGKMSKQANTKLIGSFVVGGIALVIAGVLLFGSGRLFTQQRKFVLFFDDSVSGLSIGAPVDFRGVKVGRVTDIKVVLEKEDLSLRIPVFIEFDPGRVRLDTTENEVKNLVETQGTKTFLELLINRGMRAQLVMQSLVTGQLGIHLDFFPDKPARLVGAESGYPEIPTVESSLSELAKTVQNIPVAEIADRLLKILDRTQQLVYSPELQETVVSINQSAKAMHSLLVNLDGQVKPLAANADLTLAETRKTMADASKLARNVDARIPQILASLDDTLKTVGVAMRGANKVIDGITADNSPVRLELMRTLNEFASAARSFRVLVDYIESHPEALVRGKGK